MTLNIAIIGGLVIVGPLLFIWARMLAAYWQLRKEADEKDGWLEEGD